MILFMYLFISADKSNYTHNFSIALFALPIPGVSEKAGPMNV